jgi:hypothetical protein
MNVEGSDDAESFNNKLTHKIEAVVEAIQSLEEYEGRLGEKDDRQSMRDKMKLELGKTDKLIQETESLLKQFESMKMKKKDESTKIIKRTKESFNKQKEKYTKVKRAIESKEKIYLEPKRSVDSNSSYATGTYVQVHSDIQIHVQDVDAYDKLLEDRAKDVQEIRKYADQLKGLAQDQADKLQENSEIIDVIEVHIEETEKNTEKGNKELDKKLQSQKLLSKKNVFCCAGLAVICGVVAVVVFAEKIVFW